MRKTDLLDIIRRGENSGIVFRPDTIANGAFAEEVAALLNLRGGRVILGVEDDGSVTGISRDRLEEWVMTAYRDKIRPELIPYYEVLRDVEAGSDISGSPSQRYHAPAVDHRLPFIKFPEFVSIRG